MTITKHQLAGLLYGLGSSYAGGYIEPCSVITIEEILKVLVDKIIENPTETYEVPPARNYQKPTVSNEDELT